MINGCSLIEISEVGRLLKICEFSNVAFMKKFGKCAQWFQWISEQFIENKIVDYPKPLFLEDYRVIAFDASDVVEKSRSGQIYRLHYGIDIFKMSSVSHTITKTNIGEKLQNFILTKGDLAVGYRAYGTISGINYCIDSKADYILRLRAKCFAMYNEYGDRIDIISQLSGLDYEASRDFTVFIKNNDGELIPIRICAKAMILHYRGSMEKL